MRILVITDLYPPHFLGGYELQCREQVEELRNRGHQVSVLASRWGVGRAKAEGSVYRLLHFDPLSLGPRWQKGAFDPLRLCRRWAQLKLALRSRANYRLTRDLVSTLKPDMVYIWHMGGVSIGPVLAAQRLPIPTVFNMLDYWLADLKAELCLEPSPVKRRYRAAIIGLGHFSRLDLSHILVCSRSLMESYLELGFPEQSITVIPPGVPSRLVSGASDLSDLTRKDDDEVNLLFAGRVVPEKGPDVAIEAMACLLRRIRVHKVRLDIIGTGPEGYVAQLRTMVAALDLGERVAFVGRLGHQELLERYTEYDALLFTSRWAEPFGITILEAMARGLPVIGTNVGGVPEIVADGENGLLVPPDEPTLLADAVKRLVDNPGFAQRLRDAALTTVRDSYTQERIVDRVEEYLRTVLLQAHRAPDRGG